MFKSARKLYLVLTIILSMVLLAGCSRAKKTSATGNVSLKYAKGFQIENLGDGCQKVIDGDKRTIILVPKGKKAPSGYEKATVINIPVKSVVITSTTQAALMRPLSERGTIVGVNTDKKSWYIDQVKQGMEQGKVKLIGNGMGTMDYDEIVALKPDLVFMSTGGTNDAQDLQKLEQLKIPVVVDKCWLENDPLGRLEWVKFFGSFFGKEEQATTFFNDSVQNIKKVTDKVATGSSKPKVVWGMIYQGKVYAPAGSSYVSKMIRMAGGDYIFPEDQKTGNVSITLEEYYAKCKEVSVYLDDNMGGTDSSIASITSQAKVIADLPVFTRGSVYTYQPWYWQSLDKTDQVIADLAFIFHPSLFPGYQLKHFYKLPQKS